MKKLDRLLSDAIEQREIVKAAQAWQALDKWPQIVGEALAKRSWPDRVEGGTVYVAVSGPAWAQELRMQKPTILARVGELLGNRALVQDVRFGVRELPARAGKATAASCPRPQGLEESDASFEELKDRILRRADKESGEI